MPARRFSVVLALLCAVLAAGLSLAADKPAEVKKQTRAGLYVTAAEAYARWSADREGVTIIDVRTPEEYAFVGHAPMAVNIPLLFATQNLNPEKRRYALRPNPDFVQMVRDRFRPDGLIMLMCRSGSRSAAGVNKLAEAGVTAVYSIVDGFEGAPDTDRKSPTFGQHVRDGWKNSGLPVTYDLEPDLAYTPRG